MADDVHDLFDTGESDESDEEPADDGGDDAAAGVDWNELESLDDDVPGAPHRSAGDPGRETETAPDDATGPSRDRSTATGRGDEGSPVVESSGEASVDDGGFGGFESAEDTVESDRARATASDAEETPSETDESRTRPDGPGATRSRERSADAGPPDTASSSAGARSSTAPDATESRVEDPGDARPPDDGTDAVDDRSVAASAGSTPDRGTDRADQTPTAPEAAADSPPTDGRPTTTGAGSNRLSTGIDVLDEAMGGGVPPGRLVLLVADPGVQSELIVDSVLAQRDTLFISTDRPDWEVTKDIEPGLGSGEIMVRDHTPDTLLSGVDSLLDELDTSSNFVLDSVNELELVPRARYRIFLSDVKRRLFDTGSIGLLTGVTVDHESARDLTLRRADIVWRLETRTVDNRIENRLSVPKFRGGAAMTETVKIHLTDEVKVDTGETDR